MEFVFENNGLPVRARFSQENVDELFLPLLRRLTALRRGKGRRVLAMLAAPPGAGKSTLAAFLQALAVKAGEREEILPLTVIGMDGFHRRQADLLAHTTVRDGVEVPLVKIKGAPETFDLKALQAAVARVAAGEECGWPRYDRLLHDPVEDALRVTGEVVLLEGNYLLLDEAGWKELRECADYTIALTAPLDLLRARLVARHMESGKPPEAAEDFVDRSDLVNARQCLERALPADLRLALRADDSFERLA